MGSRPKMTSPRDVYVRSEKKISIRKLAEKFKGQEGCSEKQLENRCAKEKWVDQRAAFWAQTHANAEAKASELASSKIAKRTLDQLNEDAYARTIHILKINEQKLKDGMIKDEATGKFTIKLSAREIRTLQANIADCHHELRLYSNFHPDQPVETVDDNSDDDEVIKELFGDLFELFQEGEEDV